MSVFIDADPKQVKAAERVGARVCEIHTGPYAHAFYSKGRDAESPAVLEELDKIRKAGEAIRKARIVGNPGCYPTAVQLGFLPLLEAGIVDAQHLIADCKSGVSGPGAKPR